MGNSGSDESGESRSSPSATAANKVLLNVYSPTGAQHVAYHSGVEVLGAEYVYGGSDTSYSGVSAQIPRVPPAGSGWVFYQSVEIGSLARPRDEVLRAINELKATWPGSAYDLVSNNCNHFSDAMCQRLCGQRIPSWVNRLAGVGDSLRGVLGTPAPAAPSGPAKADGAGGPAAAGLVSRSIGADGDLSSEVDWSSVGVLNAVGDGVEALRGDLMVLSDEDTDAELLFLVPFVAPVKLRALRVETDEQRAPVSIRLFANKRDLDMNDAGGGVAPTQLVEDIKWVSSEDGVLSATIELNFLKFQTLGFLAVHFAGPEDGVVAIRGVRFLGKN